MWTSCWQYKKSGNCQSGRIPPLGHIKFHGNPTCNADRNKSMSHFQKLYSHLSLFFFFLALVEYKAISKKTLQDSIESEMSGNLEKLLVAVGEKNVSCCLPVSDSLHWTVVHP